MSAMGNGALLKMRGITKSFPGVRAVDGVTFDLFPGEIHALVGENGAGKTVLMCALFWALGGARQVEDPVWTKCTGVRLQMTDVNARPVTLYRVFSDRFDASIEVDGKMTRYENEGDWAEALLPLFGIEPREWSGNIPR